MISAGFSPDLLTYLRRAGAALGVTLVLAIAYAVPVSLVLREAAFLADPGDRLVVIFPPGTPTGAAVERLGAAGSVFSGTTRLPQVYRADVLDPQAARRLAERAWVMRIPAQPTLSSCFGLVAGER